MEPTSRDIKELTKALYKLSKSMQDMTPAIIAAGEAAKKLTVELEKREKLDQADGHV